MKKGKTVYKRQKLTPGWTLEMHKASGTYILSVPQIDIKSAKSKLNTLPGVNNTFIISEIYEGNEIYFRCRYNFPELVKALYDLFDIERINKPRKTYKRKKRRLFQYKDGILIKTWESASEAAEAGYNQGQISRCCTGKIEKYYDCTWKYETI